MTIVEGLADGRVGLLAKVHHSAMDGTSGVEVMMAFFDLEPDPPKPPKPPKLRSQRSRRSRRSHPEGRCGSRRPAAHVPADVVLFAHAAIDRLRSTARAGRLLRRTGESLIDVARGRSERMGPSGGTPAQRTPHARSTARLESGRDMAFAQLSLDEIKRVKNAVGSTVNDVVLAVCARALRQYLLARRALPDVALLASCPVSIRTESERGHFDNRVSVMFTKLHTEIDDPLECLLRHVRVGARGQGRARADRFVHPRRLGRGRRPVAPCPTSSTSSPATSWPTTSHRSTT